MSLMVSSVAASLLSVPMIAVSPSSTLRRVMRPLIGAMITVFARFERASRSEASICPTMCRAASYAARLTSAVVFVCSIS